MALITTMDSSTRPDSLDAYARSGRALLAAEWSGMSHTKMCARYSGSLNSFHRLDNLLNCWLWMTKWIESSAPVLAVSSPIKLPAVSLYELRLGATNGIRLGFIIRTPLDVLNAQSYLLMHRRQDPLVDCRSLVAAECVYRLGGLLFFSVEDNGVLLVRNPQEPRETDYLET